MDVQGISIDGPSTRDIDDAIWVEADGRGWVVTVCISHVAAAVATYSNFDQTARRRVASRYLPGGASHPMIPRMYSEGSCSLLESEDRRVMGIRLRLNHDLEPQGLPFIGFTRLKNKKRLEYAQVPRILEDSNHEFYKQVSLASRLAESLVSFRRDKGALVIYDASQGLLSTETGSIRRLKNARETIGHVIVQEMMILANSQVARYCIEKQIPVPFRNHGVKTAAPDRNRMMELLNLQANQAEVDGASFSRAQKSFLMVMEKAKYSASSEGHYGLNLPAYVHATSPIRRYADLVTQRQIFHHLEDGNLPYTKEQIQEECDHVNSVLEKQADLVSKKYAEMARKESSESIRSNKLKALSDKDFKRALSMVIEEGKNTLVSEEYMDRLKSGKATLICMYKVLFCSGDEWKKEREATVIHIADNIHLATSIATIASQDGKWSALRFRHESVGDGSGLGSRVTLEVSWPGIRTLRAVAPTKKLAQHRACLEAICMHIGMQPYSWADEHAKWEPMISLSKNSDNPISELMEYCQAKSVKLPDFDFFSSDKGYQCSCSVVGLHVKSGPHPNKKAAKKDAARKAIQLIVERS